MSQSNFKATLCNFLGRSPTKRTTHLLQTQVGLLDLSMIKELCVVDLAIFGCSHKTEVCPVLHSGVSAEKVVLVFERWLLIHVRELSK